MKRLSGIAAFSCAMVLALPWSAAGQDGPGSKSKAAPTEPGVVIGDRGKFRLLYDGQQVGTEEFAVTPSGSDWISRGSVEIKIPGGGTTQVSAELRLAADGRPLNYQWSSQGPKKVSGAINFVGSSARMELRTEGSQPFTQEFQFDSPQVVILDNNLYHHYGILARLYDWNAKGAQTFAVLIPQDQTPGTVTVEWSGPQEIEGIKAELLRVKSADLEIELYVSNGRLVRLAVPTSKAEIRRE
ncbi:MAG: hypothetical protein HY234_15620 [Acidobacteria bacterium]|nr:hypothetical protein [Acidobacteriota bacterium]MBI3664463.1 hypothetical protein [Acidobacteriota bacterium]